MAEINFYNIDCIEFMKTKPDKYYDLAIVDPPYGINMDGGKIGGNNCGKAKDYTQKNWDNETPTNEYWNELFRVSKNQIVWGGNYFDLPLTKSWTIWDKNNGESGFADGEMAWNSFNKPLKIKKIHWCGSASNWEDTSGKIHPTQKPVKLYSWQLQEYATEGMKLLDTHFGSGSIALAVDKANRLDKMNLHLTACEIDKEYIDKAIKRISESIKQGTLSF